MKTYDPNQYDVIFSGYKIRGFSEGTMLSLSPETGGFSSAVGVDGEVTRNRIADRRHTLTLSLMATAESNDDLSALYAADRAATNGEVGDLRIVDRAGTTVVRAAKAWIQNGPDLGLDDTVSAREWEIVAVVDELIIGSNPDS